MQKITFSKKLSIKFKISRKQAESLIKNKKVTLNGDIETRPFLSVTDKDIFESQQEIVSLKNLKTNLKNTFNNKVYFVSALSKKDINSFKKDLYKSVRKIHVTRFPYNAFLYPDIK